MNRRIFWCWAGLVLAGTVLAATGCSDQGTAPEMDGGDPGFRVISYAADIQPIFAARCLGCHGAGGNGGLDLRASVSYANLVGVASMGYDQMRVTAGKPTSSSLYLKLIGDPSTGGQMPLGGALTATQIDLVRDWIVQGALDN